MVKLQDSLWILCIFVLWSISGAIMGLGLSAMTDGSLILPCTSLNAIIGLLLLVLITRNEKASRVFYEAEEPEDNSGLTGLFLLVVIPFNLIIFGVAFWLFA